MASPGVSPRCTKPRTPGTRRCCLSFVVVVLLIETFCIGAGAAAVLEAQHGKASQRLQNARITSHIPIRASDVGATTPLRHNMGDSPFEIAHSSRDADPHTSYEYVVGGDGDDEDDDGGDSDMGVDRMGVSDAGGPAAAVAHAPEPTEGNYGRHIAKNMVPVSSRKVAGSVALNVQVDALGIANAIAGSVARSRNRSGFVKSLMYAAFYNAQPRYRGRLNVMVFNLAVSHTNRLRGVKMYATVRYGRVVYGVFVFRNGYWRNRGDGGYINWAFMGWFKRRSRGRVYFR